MLLDYFWAVPMFLDFALFIDIFLFTNWVIFFQTSKDIEIGIKI